MSKVQFIKVEEKDDGMRLDRWFKENFPQIKQGQLQKFIRAKQVKLDGKKTAANERVAAGQEIRIPPIDEELEVKNKQAQISKQDAEWVQSLVIYKDKNIIVLNKPSGIAVQGGTKTTRHIDGLLDALKFDEEEKPRLVHRIDKDTSGILVLARNRKYATKLTSGFKDKTISKTYWALCHNKPTYEDGIIKAPLAKLLIKGNERMVVNDKEGQKSETEFKLIDSVGNRYSLIEAKPLTGRTHQIRAHMEYMKCPIVGDNKYFGEKRIEANSLTNRLHLHAKAIDLSSIVGKKLIIEANLPDHMIKSMKFLGLPQK